MLKSWIVLLIFASSFNCETYYIATSSTFNPIFMKSFSMIAFNNSDGMSNINITFELLATLDKAIVTYVLKQKISDFIMWRGSIDTCVITQGILGRYILRSLQSNSKKYGNFSLNCPHRKGFYVIRNLPRVDEKNFASIAPRTRKPWEIKFTIKGKINKSSRYLEVVTFALQGLSFM